MKKITYKTSNLFTLKHYNDSNLNCQSYEYPTIYAIKSAILGAIIRLEGIEQAKEKFIKLKNMNIYVQFPKEYCKSGQMIKRYTNSYYGLPEEKKLDKTFIAQDSYTTMGFREYVLIDEIVFYIDNSLENIELYLKNIDFLGTAESLVYLDSIEEVSKMEGVLIPIEENELDKVVYEQHDYATNTTFDNIYMYSPKRKHIHKTYMCKIEDINCNNKEVRITSEI